MGDRIHMSDQHIPEFEDRLRALLARAAEAIPDDADISARVRQVPARDLRYTGIRAGGRGLAGPRAFLATAATIVVVALLAGVLLFFRPLGSLPPSRGLVGVGTATAAVPLPTVVPTTCVPFVPGTPYTGNIGPNGPVFGPVNPPAPTGTPVDNSVAIGGQVTVQGVTITLERAYADASQTVVTYQTQTEGKNIWLADASFPILIDSHGNRYAELDVGGGAGYIGKTTKAQGEAIFAPLPQNELASTQMLTFFTQQVGATSWTSPNSFAAAIPVTINGPWQISFSLTPVAGTAVTLSNSPLTRHGVTVQPLEIDLAPPGGGLQGTFGGARVMVRISGLAPDMPLSEVASYDIAFLAMRIGGGGGGGCGGGILELVLPNGEQIFPGVVALPELIDQSAPDGSMTAGQQAQTVGPSGTVELEALFYLPVPVVSGILLYMDNVATAPGTAKPYPPEQVNGPWEFQLPPSA